MTLLSTMPPPLQNPFYETDMPIRCERFDDSIEALVRTLTPVSL
jgi:hypothetical protein